MGRPATEIVEIREAGPGMGRLRITWRRRGAIDRLLGKAMITGRSGALRLRPPLGVTPGDYVPSIETLPPAELGPGARLVGGSTSMRVPRAQLGGAPPPD